MSEKTKIEIALTLVVGISLVLLLPPVQLLPATTRAWRRALSLLPSIRRLARALSVSVVTALSATRFAESVLIPADIVALDCTRLC